MTLRELARWQVPTRNQQGGNTVDQCPRSPLRRVATSGTVIMPPKRASPLKRGIGDLSGLTAQPSTHLENP